MMLNLWGRYLNQVSKKNLILHTLNSEEQKLFNKIKKDIIQLATMVNELDPETAFSAIELYHQSFFLSQAYSDKSEGPAWKYVSKLAEKAAPLIESELTKLLTEISSTPVSKRIINCFLSPEMRSKCERIIMLAHYNEKCAEVYLDWHLKSNTHWNSLSADQLLKIAKRFPSIAPRMYEQFNFSGCQIELQKSSLSNLKAVPDHQSYEESQTYWLNQFNHVLPCWSRSERHFGDKFSNNRSIPYLAQ